MEPRRNRVYKTQNLHTITQNTKPQHFQTAHYKILVQTLEHDHPFALPSQTHSLTLKQSQPSAEAKSQPIVTKVVTLKQSQSIVNVVRSPPCQRYSLFLLNTLSFLLLRFLCLSLSLQFWIFEFHDVTQGFSFFNFGFFFFFFLFSVGVLRIWLCFGNDIRWHFGTLIHF